ncbi:hypothetical protein STEG23_021687, partial [Scotinomys teguina]
MVKGDSCQFYPSPDSAQPSSGLLEETQRKEEEVETLQGIRDIPAFRTMSFSLKLPERFSPIGFSPNKTQCALYAFDPES